MVNRDLSDSDQAAAAARLALVSLRGNIHPSMPLSPDAYALASAPRIVLTAEEFVPLLVAEAKPLRCLATVSEGVVKVSWDAPRAGTIARLAWEAAAQAGQDARMEDYFTGIAARAGRRLDDLQVLCATRDELLTFSLADVVRWRREYSQVNGGFAFDDADNELCDGYPAYREARRRGIPYVLRLGDIPRGAT